MEELRLDRVGNKRLVSIYKYDADDIVANMSLALNLLAIDRVIGQES
jgi:hypothetical protein